MDRLVSNSKPLAGALAALALLAMPMSSASAGSSISVGGKHLPKIVFAKDGSPPEGFAVGRGYDAFNGSIDGSVYKMNLLTGMGEILVEAEPGFNLEAGDCFKLGMRVDPRTNYLFVAGCEGGNAYVYDADSGELLMNYQLPLPLAIAESDDTLQIVNDLVITKRAVYFTDSHQALVYKLPLSKSGELPGANAATAIELVGEFVNIPSEDYCCGANGIVASANGKTLIIGHSNNEQLFNVDPDTGYAVEIAVDYINFGFIDGIVIKGNKLYVLTSSFDETPEMVQVLKLNKAMTTATYVGFITDPSLDGIASGGLYGQHSLYVNNARYNEYPQPNTQYWITRLDIHAVQ